MMDYCLIPVKDLIAKHAAVGFFIRNHFGDIKLGQLSFNQILDGFFSAGYAEKMRSMEELRIDFTNFCQSIENIEIIPHDNIRSLVIQDKEDKSHRKSINEIELKMGTITAIVGPTSSGKSALLDDIEGLVAGSSITHRHILIDGHHITGSNKSTNNKQYTERISLSFQRSTKDADTVEQFIIKHLPIHYQHNTSVVSEIIASANSLIEVHVTALTKIESISDRQLKALLLADVALTSTAPIIMLDELESFGIQKIKALRLMANPARICILATHDPLLILMCNQRVVLENGAVSQLIVTSDKEKAVLQELLKTEKKQIAYRESFRNGEVILL